MSTGTTNFPVCYYHIRDTSQGQSTLQSYLNVKKFPTRNRCDMWSESYCNEIRPHNHLVLSTPLYSALQCMLLSCHAHVSEFSHGATQMNHLASLVKWLSFPLQTKWLWVQIPLPSLKLQKSPLFRAKC